jgi:hypothetical protein
VNDAQSPGWGSVGDNQTPNWTEVAA